MKIHGNDIIIHRGETFTLSMNVKMRDGTPFIMTYDPDNVDAHNPYILITIASSKYVQKGSYVKNWWLPMSDKTPSFTSTEIKTLTGLDQTPSDGANERYLYYNQQDGKYYYHDGNSFNEYAFKIHNAFLHEDTNALVSQSYYYSVTYVDGTPPIKLYDYLLDELERLRPGMRAVAIGNGWSTEKIIEVYLGLVEEHNESIDAAKDKINEIRSKEDTGLESFTQVTPIVSPSKLTVLSNLRGGL